MKTQEMVVNGYQAEFATSFAESNFKSRLYVLIEDETLQENFINRRNRPTKIYRELAEKALENAGIKFDKLNWSSKAGCSMCPCSPGFIVQGSYHKDFYLTIKNADELKNDGNQRSLEFFGSI